MKKKRREWEPTSKRKKFEGEPTKKRKPAFALFKDDHYEESSDEQFIESSSEEYVEKRQRRPSRAEDMAKMEMSLKIMLDQYLEDHTVEDAVTILAELITWVVSEYEND